MKRDDGFYKLPDLPYPQDALEPHMSRETLACHHGKHHRGYVTRLNEMIAGTPLAGRPLDEVVITAEGALFNQAAQAFNHGFFWRCLSPERGLAPRGALARAIDSTFGSLDACLTDFNAGALGVFGSGWAWLVLQADGALAVETTHDADTPLRRDATPLLVCDVWEHAYYLDYRNDRKRYLDAFLRLIDWEAVSVRYESASKLARVPSADAPPRAATGTRREATASK